MHTTMVAGVSAICVVLASWGPTAQGAEPASGTLSGSTRTITYTAGPFFVSNPSSNDQGGRCPSATACDHFELTIDLRQVNPEEEVRIELTWNNGSEDFDMYLLDPGGAVVKSGATPRRPEIMVIPVSQLKNAKYRIRIIPYVAVGGTTTTTITLQPPMDPCLPSGQPNQGSALLSPGVARDLAQLPASSAYGAFVHFSQGTPDQRRALLGAKGLAVAHSFERYASSVYAVGTVAAFRELARERSVSRILENRSLQYFGETASWATRARMAQEHVAGGPYRDLFGRILTGERVTIVVVDSGVNAPHPDFEGRVRRNFKIVGGDGTPFHVVDFGPGMSTDTTSGHGTHVAGIALGSGAASTGDYPVRAAAPLVSGTFTGVAPGASLVAYGAGEGLNILSSVIAFEHILENYDNVVPRIRVVSNSWGSSGAHDPADTLSCLTRALVDRGVSVLFAAGNGGGDGRTDETSPTCKDPTPGVICVANYDDNGTGALNHGLASSSSRGKKGDPANYPDIAAPGTDYTSTCSQTEPGQAVCSSAETRWQPWYGTITGTSMATPHVSGALALLYQFRPELTPAEAEKLLQDTAHKVTFNGRYEPDPQNPGGTVNFGVGAGLLNVQAALDALGALRTGLPPAGGDWVVLDGDEDPDLNGAEDVIRLDLAEATTGTAGLTYRVTVRDARNGSASYSLEQVVNGSLFFTRIFATPTVVTVAPPGPGNTAPAESLSREGNIITFFVPYSRLGFPPSGAPVHNIRMLSDTDFAPSPAEPATDAALEPMYGRPFTVQRDGGPPPLPDPCTLPGIHLITDDDGDATNQQAEYDIRSVHAAEPSALPGRIAFTLRVADLSMLPPNTFWALRFIAEKPPANGHEAYFVGLSTAGGSVRFVHGTSYVESVGVTGVTVYEIAGEIDSRNSGYTPDGAITLVADRALFGLVAGDLLNGFLATVRTVTQDSGPIGGGAQDSAEGGFYVARGGGACGGASGSSSGGSSDSLGGALDVRGVLGLALCGWAVLAIPFWRRRAGWRRKVASVSVAERSI